MRHLYFFNHSLGSLLKKEHRQNRMAQPAGWVVSGREQSSRFLKSGAKTLLNQASGVATGTAQIKKVFLLLFVHKK
jgi:hypothetical protein